MTAPPLIYNLFPRLVGAMNRWPEHARRAADMGFNWFYINPWHYPGFSGSLYAPKEFRRLNPLFVPAGGNEYDLSLLSRTLDEIQDLGVAPMMDLIVNHTSKDSPLAQQHPEWYLWNEAGELVSPSVVDPDDPTNVTVWGDLAEVDNERSRDRHRLWAFWSELVNDSLRLGFRAFRCDAAYKVPAELWKYLITEARRVDPGAKFFAETLGAPVEAVLSLREAGFDYFFNSSKWWDFRSPWALEQHERFGRIAPSISFPETHDTTRLAADTGGDQAVQRQRYAFAAAFSAGLMMPIGYEYGFRRQVDVVTTMPTDWERRSFDLRPFVTRVNKLKASHRALQGEGSLRVSGGTDAVLVLERRPLGGNGRPAWILVNTRTDGGAVLDEAEVAAALPGSSEHRLHRICRDDASATGDAVPARVELDRAEVVYVLPGQH